MWLVRFDDSDDWYEYPAQDAEDAALRAGEDYDNDGDYTLAKGGDVEISVRRFDQETSEALVFTVCGEAVMQYNATLKEDEV